MGQRIQTLCFRLDSLTLETPSLPLSSFIDGPRYRQPRIEDLDALFRLIKEAFSQMGSYYQDSQKPEFTRAILSHKSFSRDYSWLLLGGKLESQILGTCLVKMLGDGVAYISLIAVSTAFQRRGLGSFLLRKTLSSIKAPCRFVLVDIRSDNLGSIKLFKDSGFIEIVSCIEDFASHCATL